MKNTDLKQRYDKMHKMGGCRVGKFTKFLFFLHLLNFVLFGCSNDMGTATLGSSDVKIETYREQKEKIDYNLTCIVIGCSVYTIEVDGNKYLVGIDRYIVEVE